MSSEFDEVKAVGKYHRHISSVVIGIIAFILLCLGVGTIVYGFVQKDLPWFFFLYGLGGIIAASFMFVLYNISDDLNILTYHTALEIAESRKLRKELEKKKASDAEALDHILAHLSYMEEQMGRNTGSPRRSQRYQE